MMMKIECDFYTRRKVKRIGWSVDRIVKHQAVHQSKTQKKPDKTSMALNVETGGTGAVEGSMKASKSTGVSAVKLELTVRV